MKETENSVEIWNMQNTPFLCIYAENEKTKTRKKIFVHHLLYMPFPKSCNTKQ